MAQTSAYVAAGKPNISGGILFAPLATALPTDASTSLIAAYKALGYAAEGGLEPTAEKSTTDVKAWGGDVVDTLLEGYARSFKFTLIEVFNPEVNKEVFNASNVVVTAATPTAGTKIAISEDGLLGPRRIYVFDMFHNQKKMRIVCPQVQMIVTGEGAYQDKDLTSYECEVKCYRDASGKYVYRYLEDDNKTA